MTAVTSASGAPDALEIVEGEVRELVQRREVELDDSIELHVLLDEVVDDYRERFLRGGLPPLTDDDVQLLRHRLAGVGALTPLLDDPEVEEIWVNEPGRVFVARRGEHELTTLVLSARDVE